MLHYATSDLSLHCLLRPVCRNTQGKLGTLKTCFGEKNIYNSSYLVKYVLIDEIQFKSLQMSFVAQSGPTFSYFDQINLLHNI